MKIIIDSTLEETPLRDVAPDDSGSIKPEVVRVLPLKMPITFTDGTSEDK